MAKAKSFIEIGLTRRKLPTKTTWNAHERDYNLHSKVIKQYRLTLSIFSLSAHIRAIRPMLFVIVVKVAFAEKNANRCLVSKVECETRELTQIFSRHARPPFSGVHLAETGRDQASR